MAKHEVGADADPTRWKVVDSKDEGVRIFHTIISRQQPYLGYRNQRRPKST